MTVRSYSSPAAFKQALEQRLKSASKDGLDFSRRRQLLVFDRFLARVSAMFGDAVLLKGGLVLELRLQHARATKDVDLQVTGSPVGMLASLQQAGRRNLGDFMTFELSPDAEHPVIENDGMQYAGRRFRATCRLAGKLYGQHFGVDVAFGDQVFDSIDVVTADDVLDFAGIAPPILRLYPIEHHIAEKLHAYTMPRKRLNTRVKDLPDMALLAGIQTLDFARLRGALDQTFMCRATHPLPPALPDPPSSWSVPYEVLARDNDLAWSTLDQLTRSVAAFLNPALAGKSGVWHPSRWSWE